MKAKIPGENFGAGPPTTLMQKTAAKSAALIPQPHGGAIYRGGVRGNSGGPGRPPSELRARLRGSFEDRFAVLEAIADDAAADPSDRIRAIEVMAKYGIGPVTGLSDDTCGRTVAIVVRREI